MAQQLFYKDKLDDEDHLYECEKAIYERLGNHPNILRFLGEQVNPDTHSRALTFPYHPAGTLFDGMISRGATIPHSLRLTWAKEIASALLHIHSKGVTWVDMSPVNILLTEDDHLVICDFGGSSMKPHFYVEIAPSPIWLAPLDSEQFTENQDRFSFGVMLLVLFTLRQPHCQGRSGISLDDCLAIHERHRKSDFDRALSSFQPPKLEAIAMTCWRMEYESTQDLAYDLGEITSVAGPTTVH